ncbi:hypothetical protein Aperf_G00000034663 [Anoplocephala perfoliata]
MFEDSVGLKRTHCGIPNYIPSLSASVDSGFRKRIWIASIGISCTLRLNIHAIYNHSLTDLLNSAYSRSLHLTAHFWVHLIEISSLFLLTIFTSVDNFPVHRNSFGLFVISCSLFGLLDLYILSGIQNSHPSLISTVNRKWRCYLIMTTSIFLSALCYVIHNRTCFPHLYSLFALTEHVFILANAAYHYYAVDIIGDLPFKIFDPQSRTPSLDFRM